MLEEHCHVRNYESVLHLEPHARPQHTPSPPPLTQRKRAHATHTLAQLQTATQKPATPAIILLALGGALPSTVTPDVLLQRIQRLLHRSDQVVGVLDAT